MNAALEYDDGEWECQVTASDFAAQDALTSRPVKLVVRGKTSDTSNKACVCVLYSFSSCWDDKRLMLIAQRYLSAVEKKEFTFLFVY